MWSCKDIHDRSPTTGPVLVIRLKLRSCCAQCLWIWKIYCHMFRVEKPKSFSRISSVLSVLLYIPRPFLQPQCFTPHPRINRLTLLACSGCSCLNLIYIKWISSVIFSATTQYMSSTLPCNLHDDTIAITFSWNNKMPLWGTSYFCVFHEQTSVPQPSFKMFFLCWYCACSTVQVSWATSHFFIYIVSEEPNFQSCLE